jgi:hypothetical protein
VRRGSRRGAAEAHRHAEALARADGDVGAQLARRGEQGERQQVGRRDHETPAAWAAAMSARSVVDRAVGGRVLHEHAEDRGPPAAPPGEVGSARREIGDDDLQPSGSGPGRTTARVCGWVAWRRPEHGVRLRPSSASTHMSIASAAAVPSSSSDALAIGRPVRSAIIVWKLSSASRRPCEISAGRACMRCTSRVLEDVAQDHRRGDRAVVAQPDHRAEHRVACG